jgi:YD repeat-containing protein
MNSTQLDTYGYVTGTHRLDSISGTHPQAFGYDQAGNTINRNGMTQAFDDRGRLSQITDDGSVTTYSYNAMGQRMIKTTPNTTTKYVYAQHQLLLESHGTSSREIAYLNGQPPLAV